MLGSLLGDDELADSVCPEQAAIKNAVTRRSERVFICMFPR
jgi:hypothetical protein